MRTLIIIAYCLLALVATAQDENAVLQPVTIIKDSISDFTVDNLGNIYLVGRLQQVKKLNNNLDSLAVFNDVRHFGNLYYVDASNPLKVLLFYRDFNTILVLDRFLNIRTTIDLRQSNIFQCSAIGQSYDNNMWVFDELDNKIKKIDDNGKLLLESPDFRIVFDAPPRPTRIEDYNRYVYAYDSSKGLLVMDYFGAYKNLIAFKGWQNVHGISNGIVATDETGLIYYQPGNIDTRHLLLPADILRSKKIRIYGAKLYALQPDNLLHIYQLQQ